MSHSVQTLRRVPDDEGIDQPSLGGRQHFLRWETSATARLWDANGLDYDSTLSYADRPGFRCGTCRPRCEQGSALRPPTAPPAAPARAPADRLGGFIGRW
ncbi:hypothetical protein U5801_04080 [Lamprobacter modestohalophilus]|uniref:hypothetical protein n=1 Tax=Lamprobacter modestohalophilus TaxID=1064514 RepID=UPI002ADEBD53|nr:hypothetical protein [Lamprobacter modestohalophilus]MEA1048991.1 hypothetical protein [Lamprobacter modestohalophilus]